MTVGESISALNHPFFFSAVAFVIFDAEIPPSDAICSATIFLACKESLGLNVGVFPSATDFLTCSLLIES